LADQSAKAASSSSKRLGVGCFGMTVSLSIFRGLGRL